MVAEQIRRLETAQQHLRQQLRDQEVQYAALRKRVDDLNLFVNRVVDYHALHPGKPQRSGRERSGIVPSPGRG